MIKYLGCEIGKEIEGKFFNTAREAYDYIKTLNVDIYSCGVFLIEIDE